MTDDFVSLKVMIASADAAERELIRRGISSAPIPVLISEIEAAHDEAAACKQLAGTAHDIVLFDSRMHAGGQDALLDTIRETPGSPLAIAVGEPAARVARRCDALIARPVELSKVAAVIGDCVAVRLPKRVLIVDDSAAVRAVINKVDRKSTRLNSSHI